MNKSGRKIEKKPRKTSLKWFLCAFWKKGGVSAKVIFTKVVQIQICFLSALDRILNFLQAASKVCFKAQWNLRSCADATPAPEAACHFLPCHQHTFPTFLSSLIHKEKLEKISFYCAADRINQECPDNTVPSEGEKMVNK